jgi:hypothetical protein
MKRILACFAVVSVLLLSACGGGGEEGESEGDSSSSESSSALTSAVEEISSCLTDAGLEVGQEDTDAFGVEDPHEHLEVALDSEAFDKPYNVDLWVFETPEAAEGARTAITLETKDDERGKVLDNVVVNYEIVPDPEDTEQVEGCL